MQRSPELDFARGVIVVLMVAHHVGHLGSAADALADASAALGAFRMPALLLLSGYLSAPGPGSPPGSFGKLARRLLVPYVAFESGYVALLHSAEQAGLPASNHVAALGPWTLFRYLALEPFGVYWFLHNLVLCRAAGIAAIELEARVPRLDASVTLAALLLALTCLWWAGGEAGFRPSSAACFHAGFACRRSGLAFRGDRRWPLLALAALWTVVGPEAIAGHVALQPLSAWVAVGALVAVGRSTAGSLPGRLAVWCGRNSLLILVTHTFLLSLLLRTPLPAVAALEPSGALHALATVTLAVAGSVAAGRLLDRMGLSGLLFGVPRIHVPLVGRPRPAPVGRAVGPPDHAAPG